MFIILIGIIGLSVYGTRALRSFYLAQLEADLESRANLVKDQIFNLLDPNHISKVDFLCKRLGQESQTRITVILPLGEVVGDSDADIKQMNNHANRPEIKNAFKFGKGSNIRPSDTLNKQMMYFAIALEADGDVKAVVRTSVPITVIDQQLASINRRILWGGVIVVFCLAGLSLWISRRISRPIEQMRAAALRYAEGDLAARVPVPNSVELAELADSLNNMAHELYARIQTVTKQRNELETVLSSMVEGVLAIDDNGKVLSINEAAGTLLGATNDAVEGRMIQEIVRNPELQQFVENTLHSNTTIEAEISFPDVQGERFFQLHGTRLSDVDGHAGAVIVLNDMTRMRQLENLRRDFVANVSHELKTPVTSIKGFVETLLEGAMEDPVEAKRFLNIIAQQSNRLNSIIEDILCLSLIEEYGEKRTISLENEKLKPVLVDAIALCQAAAEKKGIAIELNCVEELKAEINSLFLEQAIVNLVNNAVKYSGPGSKIRVSASKDEASILISVSDNGPGIEPEHLDRIFERFYVADKARSRKLGGTGLGLAIVKHVAQAHGGEVTVESKPGVGSTFTIYLPPK